MTLQHLVPPGPQYKYVGTRLDAVPLHPADMTEAVDIQSCRQQRAYRYWERGIQIPEKQDYAAEPRCTSLDNMNRQQQAESER